MNWDIAGFEQQKKVFTRLIKEHALSHAYIFSGPDMIGKRTFAMELAKKLTGVESEINNPDIQVVAHDEDGVQTISIKQIRNARTNLSRGSYHGNYKVVIVDDAHKMTVEAQNAFLKILEEPNQKTLIILITSLPDALLDTIRSRSQEITFLPHGRKEFDEMYSKYSLSDAQKDFLFTFTHGRIGLAKQIIEEKSGTQVKAIIKDLLDLINAPAHDRLAAVQPWAREPSEDLQKRILYWILYTHTQAKKDVRMYDRLEHLSVLFDMIRHPEYKEINALERFALQL